MEPLKCLRCGHEWFPRSTKLPKACPNRTCHVTRWDKPPSKRQQRKKEVAEQHRINREKIREQRPKAKKRKRNWPVINKTMQCERSTVLHLLDELVQHIPEPKRKQYGRKPLSIREKVLWTVAQAYDQKSSRRSIDYLRKLGVHVPHFNTVLNALNDPALTTALKQLIYLSSSFLKNVEYHFATDGSGFSTDQYGRWLNVRAGKHSQRRTFMKAHITIGVHTSIITAVNITTGNKGDSPEFESLIRQTAKNFTIEEASADKAYSSKANLQLIDELGGIPYIPFRSNSRLGVRGGHRNSPEIWKEMLVLYLQHPELFYERYHQRSIVEAVFHTLKIKFDKYLRCKTITARTNEILVKCLAHNLCVLGKAAEELGIETKATSEQIAAVAQNVL